MTASENNVSVKNKWRFFAWDGNINELFWIEAGTFILESRTVEWLILKHKTIHDIWSGIVLYYLICSQPSDIILAIFIRPKNCNPILLICWHGIYLCFIFLRGNKYNMFSNQCYFRNIANKIKTILLLNESTYEF